jgi:hypothetical protein
VQHSGVNFITTGRLPLNTWGELEFHVITAGSGAGTLEVRLDGALVYQTSSATLPAGGILTVQIGNETARQTFDLVADNITARLP